MSFPNLQKDRFLKKDSSQTDETKSSVYTASNPIPKGGEDNFRKIGRSRSKEEDGGAPNVLTGTVITSCFIQTSALPSRIEIEGNDITLFDDTYSQNNKIKGDTSRIIFTHGSAKYGSVIEQGFIWEKRASRLDTYDNVLSLYSLPAKEGKMNYLYYGIDGRGVNANTHYISFYINRSTEPVTQDVANGGFLITGAVDGVPSESFNFAVINNQIAGISGDGFSVLLTGTGTGIIGVASDIIPFVPGLDIGSPTQKFGTFYGSVSACPLPTVSNALSLLDQIPNPTLVGERGHYGLDKLYFDDLTFPEQLLFTDSKGHKDIEHNHMLGFLLKVVVELKRKVDLLEQNK